MSTANFHILSGRKKIMVMIYTKLLFNNINLNIHTV